MTACGWLILCYGAAFLLLGYSLGGDMFITALILVIGSTLVSTVVALAFIHAHQRAER